MTDPADAHRGDFTVLDLNTRVRDLLEMAFPYPVWLRGEVARTPRANPRGHMYFQLIDPSGTPGGQARASIDCALFAGNRVAVERVFREAGSQFRLEEGMSVRLLGKVDVWPPGGRYQFIVQSIDPSWTLGEQALRLRKIIEKLRREELLDRNSSLELPAVPLGVGLITALDSAALTDFTRTLEESSFPFRISIAWAVMQGRETSRSVIGALEGLSTLQQRLDAIVVTRGGGSATDLAWFNDEALGRAIAACPLPVISGIGHEIDFTLPDYVSHTRAKTPTHAAALLVDRVADFLEELDRLAEALVTGTGPALALQAGNLRNLSRRLETGLLRRLESPRSELRSLGEGLGGRSYARLAMTRMRVDGMAGTALSGPLFSMIRDSAATLSRLGKALPPVCSRLLRSVVSRLDSLESTVSAVDPSVLLRKGWSLVRTGKGDIVSSIDGVSPGDTLDIEVGDGRIDASVTGSEPLDRGSSGSGA